MLQSGHSRDRCNLASTLCKYDLRKDDFCSELGNGATSGAGKYLFRVCCSDCVWVYVNVCCVVAVVKNSGLTLDC